VALVCDATALVALGAVGSIGLLKYVDRDVIITPWIKERELRRFSAQVDGAIEEGWLRVQEPSNTEVHALIKAASGFFELNRGEAEALIVAGYQADRPIVILIDEDEAFRFVGNRLIGRRFTRSWSLVCLAEVLHELEAGGHIDSASGTMQRLLDEGHYHWAPAVWAHYARLCERLGLIPVPRTTAQRT
jgi:predicted nucleic acid-binding protein